jgi:hydrogenase nickel incorporation protein HypA/HybF
MHETGIADGILTSAVKAAEDAGASRINSVEVTIGVLTEVMEDALQFAWEALREGTIAESASLCVTMVEAQSRCADCGQAFSHGRYDGARCPACGSYVVELVQGRELRIDAIDID